MTKTKLLFIFALVVMFCITGCKSGSADNAAVTADTTTFSATDNSLAALKLSNTDANNNVTFTIPSLGTTEYSIIALPANNPYYASLLHGISYCNLVTNNNGGYTVTVVAGQSCDILLAAAANNPPSVVNFTLNLSTASFNYPVTVSLHNYLYVGGEFTATNPGANLSTAEIYNHLAKFDGNVWSAVTNTGVNEEVNVVAIDPLTGNLYAGGWFTAAGNVPLNYLAKINRNGINALGTGLDGAVNTITFNRETNTVIVGGNFTHYLVSFNNGVWSSISTTPALTGPVRSLAYDDANNLWVGNYSPVADSNNTFGNQVAYALYKGTNNPNAILYTNDRIDSILPTANSGVFLGGDFSEYALSLGSSATTINHLGKFSDGVLTQVGNSDDMLRVVKSLALVGETLYVSGYFEVKYPETNPSPYPDPYGQTQIVAACNLISNTCININTPHYDGDDGTYWVYQLIAANNGMLYAVTQDEATADGGVGPNYVYQYSPVSNSWSMVGTTGFNHLVFSASLGSVIMVSVP